MRKRPNLPVTLPSRSVVWDVWHSSYYSWFPGLKGGCTSAFTQSILHLIDSQAGR